MLKREVCIKCFQKNEKEWNEKNWLDGHVDCPKEELHKIYPGFTSLKKNSFFKLFSNMYTLNETDRIPEHCSHCHK